jgi:hypothetical protein
MFLDVPKGSAAAEQFGFSDYTVATVARCEVA